MITVASSGVPSLTLPGSEASSILSLKSSSPSDIISLFIGTLNEAVVVLAGNMTVYGPEL